MTCSDADDPNRAAACRASGSEDAGTGSGQLTGKAQRTLDQIAEALGIATALLKGPAGEADPPAGDVVSLSEATALLQAFIRIKDPKVRESLLAHAREAATRA